MDYKIREPGNGVIEIVQFQPVVIGSFPDRGMAEKVMALLKKDAIATAVPAPLKTTSPNKPVQNADLGADEWAEDELNQAFKRREAGESLKAIAESYGKNMRKLQGKWVAYMRRKRGDDHFNGQCETPKTTYLPALVSEVKTPLQKVETVISELREQQTCSLCGSHFNITPENIDVCPRCQNGA